MAPTDSTLGQSNDVSLKRDLRRKEFSTIKEKVCFHVATQGFVVFPLLKLCRPQVSMAFRGLTASVDSMMG